MAVLKRQMHVRSNIIFGVFLQVGFKFGHLGLIQSDLFCYTTILLKCSGAYMPKLPAISSYDNGQKCTNHDRISLVIWRFIYYRPTFQFSIISIKWKLGPITMTCVVNLLVVKTIEKIVAYSFQHCVKERHRL